MNEDETQNAHADRKSSEKKVAANRRNAAKSTGPKSKKGKAKSALNAVKHGLAARTLIIPGIEKAKTFRKLHGRMRKDLRPVGVLEELDLEDFVISYWRRQRCLRSEATAFATATARHMLGPDDEDDHIGPAGPNEDDEDPARHLTLPNSLELKRHERYERARRRDLERAIAALELRQKARKEAHRAVKEEKEE